VARRLPRQPSASARARSSNGGTENYAAARRAAGEHDDAGAAATRDDGPRGRVPAAVERNRACGGIGGRRRRRDGGANICWGRGGADGDRALDVWRGQGTHRLRLSDGDRPGGEPRTGQRAVGAGAAAIVVQGAEGPEAHRVRRGVARERAEAHGDCRGRAQQGGRAQAAVPLRVHELPDARAQ